MIAKFTAALLLIGTVLPIQLRATTVVVLVSKNGIVVSTDSKRTLHRPTDLAMVGEGRQDKFVIFQNKFVVAYVGYAEFAVGPNRYDALRFLQDLKPRIHGNISIDDLAGFIESEGTATFAALSINDALKSGAINNKDHRVPCEPFAHFVIAGYQDGQPRVYLVEYDVDWNSKGIVGPTKRLLYPDPAVHYNVAIMRFGMVEAIIDVLDRRSYAHHQAVLSVPKTIAALDANQIPSLDETVALGHCLIQIEETTNPTDIGGAVKSAKVSTDGHAEVVADIKHKSVNTTSKP